MSAMTTAVGPAAILDYNREKELKQFDETKAGVKGLVDVGATKIPRIFVHNNINLGKISSSCDLPTIDFGGLKENPARRSEIIKQVKEACETWGFFQVINHEIPVRVVDGIIDGVRRFHELDTEEKKQFYSRDVTKKFYWQCNFDFYRSKAANWRDTLSCNLAPEPLQPEDLPIIIRDIMLEYSSYMMKFGASLLELFSEALGLHPKYLENLGCGEGLFLQGHYYPKCPQPELTLATSAHADNSFFTVLAQDQLGGLQVLHEDQWSDVPPLHGALIVNIGDLLQLMSNDKFISVNHRVLARNVGPRISVASFFRIHFREAAKSRIYRPIPELISEENPPLYKETTMEEYLKTYYNKGLDGKNSLSHLKLAK